MKQCTKCKKRKDASYFYKDRRKKDSLHPWCKLCCQLRQKKYRGLPKNRNKIKLSKQRYRKTEGGKQVDRKSRIKRAYNITLEQYDQMFEQQNGLCAVCGCPEVGQRLSIDHNHKTGQIRKLLCSKCNLIIGLANEDKNYLLKVAFYLGQTDGN